MGTLTRNGNYRFDIQLREGLAAEDLFYKLVGENDGRYEVKWDQKAASTGRLYVEYEHDPGHNDSYAPSGIATTEADAYVFALGSDRPRTMLVVPVEELKEHARKALRSDPPLRGHQRNGSCPTRGALVPDSLAYLCVNSTEGSVDDSTYEWRKQQLERAGYTAAQAEVLAEGRCDLHEAVELARAVIGAGQDVAIAFDIQSDEEAA